MVTKTFDMNSPAVNTVNTDGTENRSDMFAGSSALYSRINKKSKTSPWMIIAPAALVVLVGGALFATGGSHKTAAPATQTASRTTQTTAAPVASTPTKTVASKSTVTKTETVSKPGPVQVAKAAPAPAKAAPVQHTATRVATARTASARTAVTDNSPAPSAYDGVKSPAPTATQTPAAGVTSQPDTVVSTPAPSPAPVQAAPATQAPAQATPAPDTSSAPPAIPAPTATPQA